MSIKLSGQIEHVHKHMPALKTQPTSSLTNAQLVMAFQYFLKLLKNQQHATLDQATSARFIHMFSGRVYTLLHNSDIYRKLRLPHDMPAARKDLQQLIAQCHDFELQELVQLIEHDIQAQ